MEKSEFTDHAGMCSDAEILASLDKNRGEKIVFSGKVIKYNRFGMKQDRTIMLTNLFLSNIKKKEFQRKIPVNKIKAATKSTISDNFEFIVHVKKEYDYRFICEQREEFFTALKKVYFETSNENLPIYGIGAPKLKDYSTSKKDMKAGKEVVPDE
jgi:hypothetical protein